MRVYRKGNFVVGVDMRTWSFGVAFALGLHLSLEVGPFYAFYDLA